MSGAKDPLRYFRIEAREISQGLGQGVLKLEKQMTPDLVAHLLRLAHTLKGAASVVKQPAIARLAHDLEDLLAPFRARAGAFPKEAADPILAQVDAIAAAVAGLAPAEGGAQPGPGKSAAPGPHAAPETNVAPAPELDALLHEIFDAGVHLQAARRAALRGKDSPRDGNETGRAARLLKDGLDQSERALRQAHLLAEGMRLLPCSVLFAALERAVRDAAQALALDVAFVATGGDIRLDAQLLGVVQGALVQLVRNAVVHGIEKAADRADKPKQGRVEVCVARRGDKVSFIARDDGRGIDLAAVARAAQARGLAHPDSSRQDLMRLVLQGGLTTAPAVSEWSGRGIGMDIVRAVTERLGGELTAHSEPGRGTEIEFVVPVSLSSLDVLLVAVPNGVAAIPLGAVRASLRVADEIAGGDTIVWEGQALRFAALAQLLGAAGRAAPRSAVIVANGDSPVAIGVERLMGVENIVARPVPALAFADPLVGALWLNAAGVPRIVLDAAALVRAAQNCVAVPQAQVPRQPILVIDDSLTTRVLEQSILESAGFEVDLAASAEEGLQKARRRDYGLFLVDVEMPGMDGFSFVETVKAEAELKAVPAILVSSRNAPEDFSRGVQAGAHAYIVKGEFDQDKVLQIIHGLLG